MRVIVTVAAAVLAGVTLAAQETKPVPNDSVRVSVPGCSRDYIFTAGRRSEDPPSSLEITEGMRLRMSGPKKLLADIKAHEGSMIMITGLMKKGQYKPGGVGIGGVRVAPPRSGSPGGALGNPIADQIIIDVEGWRPMAGQCPSR